jgi:hypothetical protein
MFYLPVWGADDSPPVAEPFPTTPADVTRYWYDPVRLGGEFTIRIDSKVTNLGPQNPLYAVGPVTTPSLPDGGGTHFTDIVAFLSPFMPGNHTVEIQGSLSGTAITDLYGGPLTEDITYIVHVQG